MGVQSATNIKQGGTIIYTIGYDLDAGSAAPETCRQPNQSDGHSNGSTPERAGLGIRRASRAIQAMAIYAAAVLQQAEPG